MTETPIIIEDQILDHLAIPESAMRLWKERINPELLGKTDEGVKQALEFVMGYIAKHGEAPPASVISAEVGYDEFHTPEVPVDYVIEKLRERFLRQEAKVLGKKIARQADPVEAVKLGFSEYARLREITYDRSAETSSKELALSIQGYHAARDLGPGVSFGFPEIDMVLNGMKKNQLYFACGRLKHFKSWMALKSSVESLLAGKSTMFFPLEMSPDEMRDRMLCMLAGVSYPRWEAKTLGEKELKLLAEADEWARAQEAQIHFHRPDFDDRTVPSLVQIAKEHEDIVAVYIDQFYNIQPTHFRNSEQDHVKWTYIVQQLKDAAQHWPLFVTCQLNRQAANMDEMADSSKIGLTDSIPQIADMCLGLWRNQDMTANGVIQYGVMDARAHEQGTRWLIKVDLTMNSNFRVLNRVYDDQD